MAYNHLGANVRIPFPFFPFLSALALPLTICHQFRWNRCDADPQVLTDYVLALLKHDSPDNEVKNMLVTQLDDFLGEGP
jgi:hypothetical protein